MRCPCGRLSSVAARSGKGIATGVAEPPSRGVECRCTHGQGVYGVAVGGMPPIDGTPLGGAAPMCVSPNSRNKRSLVSGAKKLVIVESPTKMKSIAQYLGDGYEVLSSVGHIRDLIEPKNLPAELKKGSLGKFSVDVEQRLRAVLRRLRRQEEDGRRTQARAQGRRRAPARH